MAKFILGKKIEMSQIFNEKRDVIPVTLIEAGPCYVTQVKTKEKDGYEAVQIGFVKKTKRIKKSEKGKEFKYVREFRIMEHGTHNMEQSVSVVPVSVDGSAGKGVASADKQELKLGDEIKADIFEEGDIVKVSGISKGKGFQGVVKKWGFRGRSPSHGTKHEVRTPGSTGCRFPQHTLKGKKMPGRMGADRITVRNLKIVKIDKENNILAVKGAVPGNRGSLMEIRG